MAPPQSPPREPLVLRAEPQIIVAVDPTTVKRRHLDVRGTIEALLLKRISREQLRKCTLQVWDHVGYVVAPSQESTDRIYPPTPGRPNSLCVHAASLAQTHKRAVRFRIAYANSDAGDAILSKWPLPPPGPRG